MRDEELTWCVSGGASKHQKNHTKEYTKGKRRGARMTTSEKEIPFYFKI